MKSKLSKEDVTFIATALVKMKDLKTKVILKKLMSYDLVKNNYEKSYLYNIIQGAKRALRGQGKDRNISKEIYEEIMRIAKKDNLIEKESEQIANAIDIKVINTDCQKEPTDEEKLKELYQKKIDIEAAHRKIMSESLMEIQKLDEKRDRYSKFYEKYQAKLTEEINELEEKMYLEKLKKGV